MSITLNGKVYIIAVQDGAPVALHYHGTKLIPVDKATATKLLNGLCVTPIK